MRAVIYNRVARAPDVVGQVQAISRQYEACKSLADSRGWDIAGEFTDIGTSWKPRPGFNRLWHTVAAGETGAIIAASLDRLTRSRAEFYGLLTRCEAAGVTILARCDEDVRGIIEAATGIRMADGLIDTATPEGREAAYDFMVLMEARSESQSERVKAGRARRDT